MCRKSGIEKVGLLYIEDGWLLGLVVRRWS